MVLNTVKILYNDKEVWSLKFLKTSENIPLNRFLKFLLVIMEMMATKKKIEKFSNCGNFSVES